MNPILWILNKADKSLNWLEFDKDSREFKFLMLPYGMFFFAKVTLIETDADGE